MKRLALSVALTLATAAPARAEPAGGVQMELSGVVSPSCRIGPARAPTITLRGSKRSAPHMQVDAPVVCNADVRFLVRVDGAAWTPVGATLDGAEGVHHAQDGGLLVAFTDRNAGLLRLDVRPTGGAPIAESTLARALVFEIAPPL